MEDLDSKLDEIHKKLDLILSAFPSGRDGKPDPIAHRRYHDDEARYIEDKRKLWASVRSAVATGAVWSCLGFLALAIWHYIKLAIAKGDLP